MYAHRSSINTAYKYKQVTSLKLQPSSVHLAWTCIQLYLGREITSTIMALAQQLSDRASRKDSI